MNKYLEITVSTTHLGSELVADTLNGYSDAGIAILDVQDIIDLERSGKNWDYADENILSADKTVFVKCYIPFKTGKRISGDIERSLISLKENAPFDMGTLEMTKNKIDGDSWRKEWKQHFKPIHIDNVVVVPEWIKYKPSLTEIPIYLDSNMAFGTGEHETTSMCVSYLQKYVNSQDIVLDVGCGSGILGITASKLNAKQVIMTDIDECAVVATEHNIKLNKITNGEVRLKNLLDDESVKGNVIVCNIMAEALISFAPHIGKNLLDGGHIILSGILTDRMDKVQAAYEKAGFTFIEKTVKGEWSAMVFTIGNRK